VRLHHVAVVSADGRRLIRFLREQCGLESQMRFGVEAPAAESVAGWPSGVLDGRAVTAEMLGASGGGTVVEVIEVPERVAREVGEGPRLLSFAVTDLAATAARLTAGGIDVDGPQRIEVGAGHIDVALADISGTRFEFVRFPAAAGPDGR
jgi:catechol 2,3-dioxygenase-like lactoylglutathione lyase family enzyme